MNPGDIGPGPRGCLPLPAAETRHRRDQTRHAPEAIRAVMRKPLLKLGKLVAGGGGFEPQTFRL